MVLGPKHVRLPGEVCVDDYKSYCVQSEF